VATKLVTINIRQYLVRQPRNKRQKKASSYVRERIAHYVKVSPSNVRLDRELNSAITKYYSKRMLPLKASVNVDKGIATATLYNPKPAQPAAPQPKAEKAQNTAESKAKPAASKAAAEAKSQAGNEPSAEAQNSTKSAK